MEIEQAWIESISVDLAIAPDKIRKTANLLEDGATIPFIARYRKEMTGSLDEVAIGNIGDRLAKCKELESRKEAIRSSLDKRDLLCEELRRKIGEALTLTALEDIYLPYRPKRRTRAMIAREKGVEKLAKSILNSGPYRTEAVDYISMEKGLATAEDVLAAARDIVAEVISENGEIRGSLRRIFQQKAFVSSHVVAKKKKEAVKFQDYFDWREPVSKISGHRLLALLRGENLGYLRLSIRPEVEQPLTFLKKYYLGRGGQNNELVRALEDAYSRLLAPSLENELRQVIKERADNEAIEVFSRNLEELLLAPPLGQKRVMALDPGYRTGAKLVCLDGQGNLLHRQTIYPTQGERQAGEAAAIIRKLVKKYDIEAIGVGNGTAGRETESFLRSLTLAGVDIALVNEDGASIYSASAPARQEFPDEDITVRGAVSIGRRLQDPLAELVKIEPKSLGVGQYQHDVNQLALQNSLAEVVSRCVNRVGVEVNSASAQLLRYVAGLGEKLAEAIVAHRQRNGVFKKRADLLKVKRLGAKAYEQCAGFLRISNGENPLDNSGVHPERYELVGQMADDHGFSLMELIQSEQARRKIVLGRYRTAEIGMETLTDIMTELGQPGRGPRQSYANFAFAESVRTLEDVQEGMILPAIITNVTKFGAFADIGIKQDGLIHISQMADRFVSDPAEIVSVRQQLNVKVVAVDRSRQRISLSLKI